jgi:excisionase family DNA binding protein
LVWWPVTELEGTAGMERRTAIRTLDAVRGQLMAEGKNDMVEQVADVIRYLQPSAALPVVDLISTSEAATILGVRSINTVKRWAADGLLEGYCVGSRIKVTRASVEKILQSPIAERQRTYERELDAALAPFDAGDDPIPDTGRTHVGRKPWDDGTHAR